MEGASWFATKQLHQQPQLPGWFRSGRVIHPQAREVANEKFLKDYFVNDPVYPTHYFK